MPFSRFTHVVWHKVNLTGTFFCVIPVVFKYAVEHIADNNNPAAYHRVYSDLWADRRYRV